MPALRAAHPAPRLSREEGRAKPGRMSQRQGLGKQARLSRLHLLPQHLTLVWILSNVGPSLYPRVGGSPHGADAQVGHSEARHEGGLGEWVVWTWAVAQHPSSSAVSRAPAVREEKWPGARQEAEDE